MPATGGQLPSKAMGRAAPSFRLRNSSLNAIRLRRIFDLFDQDGDGVITAAELDGALARLGLEGDAEEVRSTVSAHAKPGSAGLEYDDFESLHRELGDALFGAAAAAADAEDAAAEAELEEAFSVFDEDGDGFISARELHAVLRKLGLLEGGDMARVRQMILAVDDNRDGKVDFREFRRMMQGIVVRCT